MKYSAVLTVVSNKIFAKHNIGERVMFSNAHNFGVASTHRKTDGLPRISTIHLEEHCIAIFFVLRTSDSKAVTLLRTTKGSEVNCVNYLNKNILNHIREIQFEE